ncbi:hypothetical protein KUCAC02_013550, partial [Chaenocephalus aceratus]
KKPPQIDCCREPNESPMENSTHTPYHIHLHGDRRLATAAGEPVAAATLTPNVPFQRGAVSDVTEGPRWASPMTSLCYARLSFPAD